MSGIVAIEDFYHPDTDGGVYQYAWHRAQDSGADVIEFSRQPLYTFTAPLIVTKRPWIRGIESSLTTVPVSQIRFVNCPGVHVVFPGNPEHPDAVNGTVAISNLMFFRQGGPTQALDHHGIIVDRRVWMQRVGIHGFPGYGVISDTGHTRIPPTGANCSWFYDVEVVSAGRSGWLFRGSDSNWNRIFGCHADTCGLRRLSGDNHGFYEDSLIGNTYWGCHSDLGGANPGGRTYYSVRPSNASRFEACYSEGPNVEVTGSSWCSGVMPAAPGVRLNGILHGAPQVISDYTQRTLGAQGVQSRYARYGTDEVWHIWSVKDPVGLKLIYSDFHKGWLTLHSGSTLLSGWGVTGAEHPRGKGLTYAPRGLLVGDVRVSGGVSPPTVQPAPPDAIWKRNDVFFGDGAMWRCDNVAVDGQLTWIQI